MQAVKRFCDMAIWSVKTDALEVALSSFADPVGAHPGTQAMGTNTQPAVGGGMTAPPSNQSAAPPSQATVSASKPPLPVYPALQQPEGPPPVYPALQQPEGPPPYQKDHQTNQTQDTNM